MGHAPQTTFAVHVRWIAGDCLGVGCATRSFSLHAVRGRAIAGFRRRRLTQHLAFGCLRDMWVDRTLLG